MGMFGALKRIFGGRAARGSAAAPIRGSYDAARTSGQNTQHWTNADAYDADAANSKTIRQRLCQRSRYEEENNGFAKGGVLTQAHYVVGRGPKLRVQTASRGMNAMVEAAWNRWCKAVKLSRKLRTAVKAKTRDGEAFLLVRQNPRLPDRVQLDLTGIECEQIQSTDLGFNDPYRIDGVRFDEWGNVLEYDLLPAHPGGAWTQLNVQAQRVPARFMLHLFREDRPGQHRAVPETTPTLNLFASGRRFREATVAAAENIANFSVMLKTQAPPNEEADLARPFTGTPIEKGMFVALPFGNDVFQPKAEQPAASYDQFTRAQINEQARPLSQPYNIAAADSSGYSFSGGRLDHLTYFVAVDTDQADIEDLVLDPLFDLWFAEAVAVYGWTFEASPVPPHTWDWPARPQIDDLKTANARERNLSTGMISLRRAYAEDGFDFEDELPALAEDYGVTPEEMRRLLLERNIRGNRPVESPPAEDDEPAPAPRNRLAALAGNNGNGRSK